ncbi:hypothetical protein ATERTT37_000022 [Aspergillus terreus]
MSSEVASCMDPQYRLILEVVYEALEAAGIPLEQVSGSKTGVFAGTMYHDYQGSFQRQPEALPRYFITGNAGTMLANRVSHFYDLRGPSVSIDTACSTTLTALHLAIQSLRAGESDMAIVAGANLLLNPDVFTTMSNLGFLSPDGISYSFDSRADGYGRGEGVAAIVLKTLPHAVRDGDPIRLIVRETAINQDGRTLAISTPSGEAQERLIRDCYQKARLDPKQTSYVEAHGTGTGAGDPLELAVISAAFPGQQIQVGSVKANIGHTEAVSGLASVIKVALAVEKGIIPPNARFLQPSKKLLKDTHIQIPLSSQSWIPTDGVCRASINNFGFGGANAHAIVERYAPFAETSMCSANGYPGNYDGHVETDQAHIYVLSAKDENSCMRMVSRLCDYATHAREADDWQLLANMAYTLGSRRSNFRWKAVCTAHNLTSLAQNLAGDGMRPSKSAEQVRLGWVFTGQGAQWFAMGRELIEMYPVFKEALLECDGYIKEMGSTWSIIEELSRPETESRVDQAEFSLPLSTALQIALVRLLWSWNIQPVAVTSHSSGEAAAAYAIGALTARSAIGISYIRGALTARDRLASVHKGGMLAVGLSRSEVGIYIRQVPLQSEECLVVGCVNSPSSVTVSGDLSAIAKLEELLHADRIFARRLKVTQAFHSSHMNSMTDAFRAGLTELFEADPSDAANVNKDVIYASPRTGDRLHDFNSLRDPMHWIECMLYPVEFESAFRRMCLDENDHMSKVDRIIEIGPHGALGGPIKQIMQLPELAQCDIPYLSCLSRGKSSLSTLRLLASELIRAGFPVDLNAINFPRGCEAARVQVLSDLPPYPWNHETGYWKEPRISQSARQRKGPVHDLIGLQEPLNLPLARSWHNVLRVSDLPWLRDHVVGSHIVFPGAGFVCMAVIGISMLCSSDHESADFSYILRDVSFAQALILPADGEEGIDLRLTICAPDQSLGSQDWQRFLVHSITADKNDWTEHCTGLVRVEMDQPASSSWISHRIDPRPWSRKTAPQDLWDSLHRVGIRHGPFFRNITCIESDGRGSWCTFAIADTASAMPHAYESQHIVHPTTLDSAIQAAYTTLPFAGSRIKSAMVPARLGCVKISSRFADSEARDMLRAQAKMHSQSLSALVTDVAVFDEADPVGEPVMELEGLVFQSLGASLGTSGRDSTDPGNTCSSWHWAPDISLVNPGWLEKNLGTGIQEHEIGLILELRRCSVHFIQEAMESLSVGDVERLSGHLAKFYAWMQRQLACAENGELGPESSSWTRDSEHARRGLRSRVVAGSANGEMICRLGSVLPAILRREVDPLEVMMDGHLLSRYYVDALKWSRSNAQASELVRLCCHKSPRARILEIGGGTGGCTQLVVDSLGPNPPVGRYDFTDVSAGFFEAARKRFAGCQDVMDFRKLDIEDDPEAQGFVCGSYDVVLACQVLHATSNMQRTLSNVRKLLKPGGKLILVETTRDELDLFFTFGLLPGWWLSEEPERQSTPSLSPTMWRSMLHATGFNGVEVEARDCDSDEFYMISTMMSTAVQATPTSCSDKLPEVLLVYVDSSTPMTWISDLQGAIRCRNCSVTSLQALRQVPPTEGQMCVFLGEVEHSMLGSITNDDFTLLTSMLQLAGGTLWVTRGATMKSDDPLKALHLGLLRTMRNESHGQRFVSLDLDPSRNPWTGDSRDAIVSVLDLVSMSDEKEFDYAERGGVIHVPRAFSDSINGGEEDGYALEPFQDSQHLLRLDIRTPGLLDSLYFRKRSVDPYEPDKLPDDWVEIEPRAFGLNFRDIMVAMGQLESNVMGFECAGVVTRLSETARTIEPGLAVGDRVCALMDGHWASRVTTSRTNVVRIPETLSFPHAASIPLAFTTAYISLYAVARILPGETVLIHAGAGGVGQAAIILAQLTGAEVFTTAGSEAKRNFLIDKFHLDHDHVFSSRDSSFVDGIKTRTRGKGVDVVLNSLAGPLLQKSFDCLARFGRFVEIGKKDLEQNSRLDMSTFVRNVSFSSVDILYWQQAKSAEIFQALSEVILLWERTAIGLIHPISEYPMSALEKAFRTMQSGQHVGKIVVTVAPDDAVLVRQERMPLFLKPNVSYLVAGGLGGIGRRICEWLVDRGARYLIILSRTARVDPVVTSLQERGCTVSVQACDVADESQLEAALQQCRTENLPPIRGVIQGAMVLKDALVSQMTADGFHAALRPKVQGSWNLHRIASDVDFFVMLSSLVGVMGGAGQANYAAAGAFQDALAEHRMAHNQPAVTIDLGMVQSIGYVAETDSAVAERLQRIGYQPLHEEEVLAVLEQAMSPVSSPTAPTRPAVIVTGINTRPGPHWAHADWMQEARFAGIKYRDPLRDNNGALSPTPAEDDNLHARLNRATSQQESIAVIMEAMGRKLISMFGLTDSEMSATQTLAGIGVDSLVAIELRNWITARFNVDISVFELMEGRTIAKVAEVVLERYKP